MYRFYMDGVLLPVPPPKMETKIKNKNKTLVLLNEGEMNLVKSPGLTEISFEVLLPNVEYNFAQYEGDFKDGRYFLDKLELLKVDLLPFRFIVTRMTPDGRLMFNSNMLVTLEKYSIIEDADKLGGDISAKITLKQFRNYETKVFTLSEDGTTATVTPGRDAAQPDELYIVAEGDTLYEIARLKLGDGELYTELMEINSIANINDIAAGQVIRLV